jgi:hypothetical protein
LEALPYGSDKTGQVGFDPKQLLFKLPQVGNLRLAPGHCSSACIIIIISSSSRAPQQNTSQALDLQHGPSIGSAPPAQGHLHLILSTEKLKELPAICNTATSAQATG